MAWQERTVEIMREEFVKRALSMEKSKAALCREYGINLFLGCGEYDAACDKSFNSCLVFGPDGELIGPPAGYFCQ